MTVSRTHTASDHAEKHPSGADRHRMPAPTTFYLRPSGNDANSGLTPGDAWKTFANINHRAWQPGDRILLEAGAIFEGNIRFNAVDATNAPITITTYGDAPATIICTTGNAITIRNSGGFVIENLIIRGPGRTNANGCHGIHLLASDPNGARFGPITLQALDIAGFYQNGIYIESIHPSDPGFEDLGIFDCSVHDNGLNGIFSCGIFRASSAHYPHRRITIRACRAFNNTGQPYWPSHSGSGIQLAFVDGALIEYCLAYNNGELNDACGGPIGIWAWEANRVIMQCNESHHNKSRARCDGGGFDLDGGVTNSIMQYNYSHDNVGAGFGLFQFAGAHRLQNNVVRYNITQHEGMGGIHLWATNSHGGIQDTLIHNNTIVVGPDQEGGIVESDIGTTHVHRTKIYNNAIITAPGRPAVAVPHPAEWDFANNAYHDPSGPVTFHWNGARYAGIAAWQTATGLDETGIEDDPRLTGAGNDISIDTPQALREIAHYRLEPNSPLAHAGPAVEPPPGIPAADRDFFGTPLPGRSVAIGACESTTPLGGTPPCRP